MNLNFTGRKKKLTEKKYSIIEINLFRPTKKSYPEFDYERICKEYLKEDASSGEDERFHDRAAEELVKRLNEKYGTKRDKKGRRLRFGEADDFMDKTVGYDLNDPFIDDTEAYDEQVPSTMDTAKGGFYVNRGKLDFRLKYVDDSDSDDEPLKKKTTEKRKIVSDDDQEKESSIPKASTSKVAEVKENGTVMEEQKKKDSEEAPPRLSANGAPPMNRRLMKPNLIKRRRLIGQPPTMKLTPSPTVKAALGVKKKLKNPMKKVVGAMNEDDLDSFLKDMVGNQEIPFDETMKQAMKDLKNDMPAVQVPKTPPVAIPTSTALSTNEHDVVATSSGTTTGDELSASPTKRGRPPGSAIDLNQKIPALSPKLTDLIDTYKKRTSEFGAPHKKIRLPPSLVDLCIKIENQCNTDGLTHAQKTRIFDALASWVLVQRNSLYIRMKMQKEKREAAASISGADATSPVKDSTTPQSTNTAAPVTLADVVKKSVEPVPILTPSAEPKTKSITVESPESISISPPKLAPQVNLPAKDAPQTASTSKAEATDVLKMVAKDAAVEKPVRVSSPKTSSSSGGQKGSAAGSSTRQAPPPSVKKNPVANPPQMSMQQAQLLNALAATNNPQMLTLLSAILQQQGDAQQQRQMAAALATMKMQSAMLAANACQSPELIRQYQLLVNNLNKPSTTTSTPQSKHSAPASQASSTKQPVAGQQMTQAKESSASLQSAQMKQSSSALPMASLGKQAITSPQTPQMKPASSNPQTKQINTNLLKNLQKMNKLDSSFRNSSSKNIPNIKHAVASLKNVAAKPASADLTKPGPSSTSSPAGPLFQGNKPQNPLLSSKQQVKVAAEGKMSSTQSPKASPIPGAVLSKPLKSTNEVASSSVRPTTKPVATSHSAVGQNKDSAQRPKLAPKPGTSTATSSSLQPDKSKALELINAAAENLRLAIEEAIGLSDEEYEPLKKRPALENAALLEKRFIWTERLRKALKILVNTFFDSLAGHIAHAELTSKMAQYLHTCILPLFRKYIIFKQLHDELMKLVPEKVFLFALPEMKEYCKVPKQASGTAVPSGSVPRQQNSGPSKGNVLSQSKENVPSKSQRPSQPGLQGNLPTIKPKATSSAPTPQTNRSAPVAQPETQKHDLATSSTTDIQA